MTDIAQLGISVDSRQVRKADKDLNRLAKSGAQTEKQADSLGRSFKRMAGPLVTLAGALASVNKAMSVQREFDKLNAQLITATGSTEAAAEAFKALEQFASETPFALQQSVRAFTQLVNLGLNPSERALISYGDTASALGKDLNQMIEAVADAAVGEFERLKEFGIKARKEGEEVAFTFRGVTTRVKNDAASIEGFLIKLGETKFAGNMARQMDTLDGAVSNLGDSWDGLFRTINEGGAGDSMESIVRQATGAVDELNSMLKSGEFGAYFDSVLTGFDGFGSDLDLFAEDVSSLFGGLSEFMGQSGQEGAAGFIAAFTRLPQNLRATVQIMAVELGHFVESGLLSSEEWLENLGNSFVTAIDIATIVGSKIQDALNPFADDVDFFAEFEKALADADARVSESAGNRAGELDRLNQSRIDSISAILLERDTTIGAQDQMIVKAKELRAVFEGRDRTATIKGPSSGGETPEQKEAKAIDELVVKAAAASSEMEVLFSDALIDGFNNGADSAFDSFMARLQQMAIEAAAASIFSSFGSGGGSGGGSTGESIAGFASLFAGFFDSGGNIPSGQFGIAGENGPEIIQGPANVTSTKDTAAAMGSSTSIGSLNMVFPNVGNSNEARIAAGQAARQFQSIISSSQRFA